MTSRRQRRSWPHSGHGRKTYGIKVTDLPHGITEEELHDTFNYYEIANVVLKCETGKPYAFVNFYTPSCAQTAANDMDGAVIGGKRIKCKAQTKDRSPVEEYAVKVTHISKQTTEDTLSSLFTFGHIPRVKIICCPNDKFNFAYVNYSSQSDAENAVYNLDQEDICGSQIKVKLHTGQARQSSPSLPEEQKHLHTSIGSISSPPVYPQSLLLAPIVYRSHSATTQAMKAKHLLQTSPSSIPSYLVHLQSHSVATTSQTQAMMPKLVSYPDSDIHPVYQPNTAESCCVKVSIFGELNSEDIYTAFSSFGKIRRPYIRGRDPSFTFVNFTSPEAAADACRRHNSDVRGVRIHVKVQPPKKQGPNTKSVEVQCAPLIASILCSKSKYKKKVQDLKTKYHVQISLQPSSDSVKIVGGKEKVTTVDDVLQGLIKELESDISEKCCEIPGHAVPLFEQDSAIDELKKIKARQGIEICVLREPPFLAPVEIVSFCKDVKKCFTPTASIDAMPACSELVSYLKRKPSSVSTSDSETTWLWQNDPINDSQSAFVPYTPEVALS